MSQAKLKLNTLRIMGFIGWSREERSHKQPIDFDLTFKLEKKPRACQSDELSDTINYERLIERIKALLQNESFALLEHLAQKTQDLLQEEINYPAKIEIQVTKPAPPLPEVQGGVSFTLKSYGSG